MEKKKPRVRFCWDCGKVLWGNHHVEKEIDGHLRILHKECGKKYDKDGRLSVQAAIDYAKSLDW